MIRLSVASGVLALATGAAYLGGTSLDLVPRQFDSVSGTPVKLEARVFDRRMPPWILTWRSSQPIVADVDAGVVVPHHAGETVLSARFLIWSAEARGQIAFPQAGYRASVETLQLATGERYQLNFDIVATNGDSVPLRTERRFSTDAPDVIGVSDDGFVQALQPGEAHLKLINPGSDLPLLRPVTIVVIDSKKTDVKSSASSTPIALPAASYAEAKKDVDPRGHDFAEPKPKGRLLPMSQYSPSGTSYRTPATATKEPIFIGHEARATDNGVLGHTVFIRNWGREPLRIHTVDGALPMILERKTSGGWAALEELPSHGCGNADNKLELPAGYTLETVVPVYSDLDDDVLRLSFYETDHAVMRSAEYSQR